MASKKQKLEDMPNERKFEFSEMYIFGKFDLFTKRLKKIIEMFETMEMYSHLADSKIEGKIKFYMHSTIKCEMPSVHSSMSTLSCCS